jgi:hypothetical protein
MQELTERDISYLFGETEWFIKWIMVIGGIL